MKTPKITNGLGTDPAWGKGTICGCCGATREGYKDEFGFYKFKTHDATKLGIVLYVGDKKMEVKDKEHLHHLNTRNGPITFAIRKN